MSTMHVEDSLPNVKRIAEDNSEYTPEIKVESQQTLRFKQVMRIMNQPHSKKLYQDKRS